MTNQQAPAQITASWYSILAVFLVGCCATALVPQVVPILGKLGAQFGVSREALGWVVSLPSLACALGAFVFGIVIDRVGDRAILYAGVVIVVLGDLLVTQVSTVSMLLVSRSIQGLGYIALTVAGATIVLRSTSGEGRKRAMALWAAHTPAGFAGAILLVSPLAKPDGDWHLAFSGHAILVAAFGVLAWLTLRNRSGGAFGRSAGMKDVLTSLPAYRLGLASLGSAFLQTGLMTVVVSHLGKHYGIDPGHAALYILFAMSANLLGALVVVGTPARNAPTTTLVVSVFIAAIAGTLVMRASFADLQSTVNALIVFAGFLGIANSLIWSLMPSALPTPQAAGALGGFITQATFIGVLLGPPVFFSLSGSGSASSIVVTIGALSLLMVQAVPALQWSVVPKT